MKKIYFLICFWACFNLSQTLATPLSSWLKKSPIFTQNGIKKNENPPFRPEFSSGYYIANMRIGAYRINDNGGGCSLSESPEPRFRLNWGSDATVILNPGNDLNCGWQQLNNNGRAIGPNLVWSSTTFPYQPDLTIQAWEEDNCEDDNTYDDCFFDGDDDPVTRTFSLNFHPNNSALNVGFNQWEYNLSAGGTSYGIRLHFEVFTSFVVDAYSDANQQGRTQTFGAGDYNVNSLLTGVGNDGISSFYIRSGYKLIAYNNSDFDGYPMTYRGTVNYVDMMNDKISSFRVVAEDNLPSNEQTLLIYYAGSGRKLDKEFENGFGREVNADNIIIVNGVGGDVKNYASYNQFNIDYVEENRIHTYSNFPSNHTADAKAFKNDNHGGGFYRYIFGVDMTYDGDVLEGYDDEDSQEAARNVFRTMQRYNLKGYKRIVIAGHSRGAAVGLSSFLSGLSKALNNEGAFSGFNSLATDLVNNASSINVVALDPVEGPLPNDFHMGDDWKATDLYKWFKDRYSKFTFSEIYANSALMSGSAVEFLVSVGFGSDACFQPSPRFLHDDPTHNVHRYWLGFRHSAMNNRTEKLAELYDNDNKLPMLHVADYFNAALHDQTLFQDKTYWTNKFFLNDQLAYLKALRLTGCTSQDITTPDADLEIDTYYSQRHGGHNNQNSVSVNMHNFVGRSTNLDTKPSDAYFTASATGTYTADREFTDANGWTHYSTCKGELLLSVFKGSSGVVISPNQVTVKVNDNPRVQYVPDGTGFIRNANGAIVMNRTWNIDPSVQPNSDVLVQFYYTPEEYAAINAELSSRGQVPLSSPSQMWFYKSNATAHASIAATSTATVLMSGSASRTAWEIRNTKRSQYAAFFVVSSFSGGGGGGSNGGGTVLPLSLLSFKGEATESGHLLTWSTANEQNSSHFVVEISENGVDFIRIGQVSAKGNSQEPLTYNFQNPHIKGEFSYYRLKSMDVDGKFEYSKIILIKNKATQTLYAFPNPSQNGVFTFAGKSFESNKAMITNAIGQKLKLMIVNNTLDLSGQPSGVYFVHIMGTATSLKLVKE
jgi:predicted esterase